MSKLRKCKFIWLICKETKEILLPYRTFNKIGSMGGRVNKKKEGHDPLLNGNLEISDLLNNKKESIKALDVNKTQGSMIYSYYLNVSSEELKVIKEKLKTINLEKGEKKSFEDFTIRNLSTHKLCEEDKFCGTAKEELTKIQEEIL